jgi:TonB family protein
VKFSFRLDRSGHVTRLKVSSSTSNRFVEQTTIQMICATKFPPIPKKVIAEQGHDYADVDSEINIDRHRTQWVSPSAGANRRLARVHLFND